MFLRENTKDKAILKDWFGRQSLQFIEILTHAEQEKCKLVEGLFQL